MNTYRIILIFSFLAWIGCKSQEVDSTSYTRNCNCPMENLPDQQSISDSTFQKDGENDLFDWNLGGKISGNFKKIIDAEIDGNIKSNEDSYQISTRKILEKINNDHPELIEKAYSFKVGKVFYCTFYKILCQDSTLSDQELRALSTIKLEEFRKDFLTYTQPQRNEEFKKKVTQPKIKTEVKGDGNNTFIGDVTSHNQQGGITAQQVVINTKPEKRNISKAIDNIATVLRRKPIAAYLLYYYSADSENYEFAHQVEILLKKLKWKSVGTISVQLGPPFPKGVNLYVEKETETAQIFFNQLFTALGNKGVEGHLANIDDFVKHLYVEPVEWPTDIEKIIISIGPNPDN